VKFTRNYLKYPTVLITAKHSSSGGNAASECNGIVSWIERYVPMTGPILKDIATGKYFRVIHGTTARQGALPWAPIFPAFTVKKKMFLFNIYTVESTLGWAYLISTLRGPLFGAMEHLSISIIGQIINRTTFKTKIVSIPLGYVVVMNTNGTM